MKNYLMTKEIKRVNTYYYFRLLMIKLYYGKLKNDTTMDLKKYDKELLREEFLDLIDYLQPLRDWYRKLKLVDYNVDLMGLMVNLTDVYYKYFTYESRLLGVKSSLSPNEQLHTMFKRLEDLYYATEHIEQSDVDELWNRFIYYQKWRDYRRIMLMKGVPKRGKSKSINI